MALVRGFRFPTPTPPLHPQLPPPPQKIINLLKKHNNLDIPNLVLIVLWLFGQRVVARRDSGELEFYLNFLIGCPVTARNGFHCFTQKTCGNRIPVPQSLYWRLPADQVVVKQFFPKGGFIMEMCCFCILFMYSNT